MDYFKTDVSKREFRNFVYEILRVIPKCGLCEKYSCRHYKTYLLTCSQCKEAKCKDCFMLKTTLKILIKSLDDDGLSYFDNFIVDFLNISDISI